MKKLLVTILLYAGTLFFAPLTFAKKYPVADTIASTTQNDEMSRNMQSILRYQEKQRAKQKKEAMIRIGIGVALLVLLVVGLRRRRKK